MAKGMRSHKSHGSPMSRNTRIGAGPAGAGTTPPQAPGRAAARKKGLTSGTYSSQVGSNSTPRGMSVYREE